MGSYHWGSILCLSPIFFLFFSFFGSFYLLPPGWLNYAAMPLTLNEKAFWVIVSDLSLLNLPLHSVLLLHLCCFCNKGFRLLGYSVEISLDCHFDINVNWKFPAVNIQPLTEVLSNCPEKVPGCCGGNLRWVEKNISVFWLCLCKCAQWFVGVKRLTLSKLQLCS